MGRPAQGWALRWSAGRSVIFNMRDSETGPGAAVPGCDWRREFGAGYAVPASIGGHPGLADVSWHNDASPSFCLLGDASDEGGIPRRLWVEHPDPAQREWPAAARFTVTGDGDGAVAYAG